ncbi:hypothetical protein Tco_0276305 [Tanacetum coccineum]
MNRIPVKSLLQFRRMLKLWKFTIDSNEGFMSSVDEQISYTSLNTNLQLSSLMPITTSKGLGNSLIISGGFSFGDFLIIYAWALEVDDGFVSSYRQLFTLQYPAEHEPKLLGFSKDKEPIVEAAIIHQWHHSLQVFKPTFQPFKMLVSQQTVKLGCAEKETRLHSQPIDEPLKTFSVQTLRLSLESDTRISNILEAAREKVLASINKRE